MNRCRIAPMVGLALVFASGCVDSAQDRATQSPDNLRAATAELRQDVRSTLDEFGTRIGLLDQRYVGATEELASTWTVARDGMREQSDAIEDDLVKLESASEDEAEDLKRDIAHRVEQLTERVERAQLESVEDGEDFVSASKDRMFRLGADLRALDDEAATMSTEALREEASDTFEGLHERAGELDARLELLGDATAEEITDQRADIAQAIGALTASVRRELFEIRRGVTY